MMTFKQDYEFFIPIFIIGISFWIPEFIFKIFLKNRQIVIMYTIKSDQTNFHLMDMY